MNKRKLMSTFGTVPRFAPIAMAVCSAAFLLGAVAGTLASAGYCAEGDAAGFILDSVRDLRQDPSRLTLAAIYVRAAWFHLAAWLMGFSMLGVLGVPALAALRGFSLSFTLAVLIRIYALDGAVAGIILFGALAIFTVPIFFLVAVGAMSGSMELISAAVRCDAPRGVCDRTYFTRFLAASLLLLLLAAGERAVLTGLLPKLSML